MQPQRRCRQRQCRRTACGHGLWPAAIQQLVALVCRLMVSTFVIHVNKQRKNVNVKHSTHDELQNCIFNRESP